MGGSKQQLQPLTGLRFFLALWVMAFHRGDFTTGIWWIPDGVRQILNTGYVAVDVFFLLSGFVLSYNYPLDRKWVGAQVRKFGIARFSRIYPAYCVGLLLWAPRVISDLAKHFSATAALKEFVVAALNFSLLQAWLPQTARTWNSPGWSLSNEAFFYCVFPFAGVALWKLSGTRKLVGAGALLWIATLIAPLVFVFSGTSSEMWDTLVRYNPLLRLPSFCLGILVARAYLRLRDSDSPLAGHGYRLYIPALLLELIILAMSTPIPVTLLNNGLLLPLHAIVILGLALGGGMTARVLALPGLVFLGNVSYSMYIIHSPISGWTNHACQALLHRELGGVPLTLAYFAVVIAISSFIYKVVEEPLTQRLKMKLSPSRQREHVELRIASLQ